MGSSCFGGRRVQPEPIVGLQPAIVPNSQVDVVRWWARPGQGMTKSNSTPPTPSELELMLPCVFNSTGKVDRKAALTLYLFLPVQVGGTNYRSSLEALLRDARGAAGRNMFTGTIEEADRSRSWLAAIGYLALLDQVSNLLEVPESAGKKATSFEHLLVWDGYLLANEAAAVYALRCAFVHSYGLLNESRDRAKKASKPRRTMTPAQRCKDDDNKARARLLLHMFSLGAEGHSVVKLGNRNFRSDTVISKIAPTFIDLRSLADHVEQIIADLRAAHLAGNGFRIRPTVKSATFIRACFFMHSDPVTLRPEHEGARPLVPGDSGASVPYLGRLDSSSPPVTGFDPTAR